MELVFRRRPADLTPAAPTQLSINKTDEELTATRTEQLSQQAFQEAHEPEDIIRDLAIDTDLAALAPSTYSYN